MRTTAPSRHSDLEGHSDNDTAILEVQFDDLEQQSEASTVGMWLFLATEVMFFGGLIGSYTVYRTTAPEEIALASRQRARRRAVRELRATAPARCRRRQLSAR